MSDQTPITETPPAPKWPNKPQETATPPLTTAALANAAARAASTNSRRDLLDYLRLRRKAK